MSESKQPPAGYNFIEMEKKWLEKWETEGVVAAYLKKNDKSAKRFSFLDGPITANNPMGVHHAWGRTYKDLWQRFHNLLGYKQRFQNGFDCQGLWVEVEVEKELQLRSKKDIENLVPGDKKASIAKFVQLCKDRVIEFSDIQTNQSKRLAYFMDWDNSYFTMNDENNYMIWQFLKTVYDNGWLYKGHDSVPWCPRCETAISQHEMLTEDYKELTHETIFFKLPIITKGWEKTYLVVWTTTPWTVPANVAVGVNTCYTYGVWSDADSGEKYILLYTGQEGATAKRTDKKEGEVSLERYVFKDSGITPQAPEKTFTGDKLLGLTYTAPFDHLEIVNIAKAENPKTFHTVVDASDIVTDTEGTGLLHVAPGAGQEDFRLGKKEHLPVISVIKDNADYVEGMAEFSGKNAKKHPEIIIDFLKENKKYLLKTMRFTHRYPACWRCKAELVWKVADEWYIAMDQPSRSASAGKSRTLRERMIEVAKKIRWMPEFGLDRELDWLKNMHDWLISKKNRYWGLSLPIYECPACKTFEVIGSKEDLKNRAVSGWDQFEGKSPHKPFIDDVIIECKKCKQQIHRIEDVGNPWLDAGIVPYSTIKDHNIGDPLYSKDKKDWQQWFPADFITESFPGQFKNWFYAMIAMSTVLEDTHPYKTVLGFGTQLAEDGRPMHKSWGNSIEFNEGADKIGVDVMRWMFSRQNPADNMLFGYKRADEVRRQFYLLLWNIYKYYLEYSVLDTISLKSKKIESSNILDIWITNRFEWVLQNTEKSLRDFNTRDAAVEIETFVNDLSTWFLRRSRNRVWIQAASEEDKLSFYATLSRILTDLSIILSPFTPFITEEIYTTLTTEKSVHLAKWPKARLKTVDNTLFSDMGLVREIAEVGHRARKESKLKVRQPLATASVALPKGRKFIHTDYTDQYTALLLDELNVKTLEYTNEGEEIKVAFDTTLTPELMLEGELRELMRTIQALRKEQGVKTSQQVVITIPEKFRPHEQIIRKSILVSTIAYGTPLSIQI